MVAYLHAEVQLEVRKFLLPLEADIDKLHSTGNFVNTYQQRLWIGEENQNRDGGISSFPLTW